MIHLEIKLLCAVAIMQLASMSNISAASINNSPIGLQSYTHTILSHQSICLEELSGLTYNPDLDLLMAVSDGGKILEMDVNDRIIDLAYSNNNCTDPNQIPAATIFNDTEAIAHIDGTEYAIIEEREARISFVTIDATTSLVNFPTNGTFDIVNSLGGIPSCDNHGLEGLAYDKINEDFYTIKQAGAPELYSFKITGSPGTVIMGSSINLANIISSQPIESVHGIHYDDQSGNLIIIGTIKNNNTDHGDNDRVLIELTTTGTYVSHLDLEEDLPRHFKNKSSHNIEGVTMIGDQIILVGEGPSGSAPSKMFYLSKSPITKSPIALQSYKHKILDNQDVPVKELSGLTYNSDSELLMAIGDAGMLLEWSKTERTLNSESNTADCSNSNSTGKFYDTEAIVHIEFNEYAIMEEREAKISFVTIDENISTVDFPVNATINLETCSGNIPSCDNHGLEGLAYDKINEDFYTIKQAGNPELYTFKALTSSGDVVMALVTDLSIIKISLTDSLILESVHGLHFDDQSGNLLMIGTISNSNTDHGDNDRLLVELTTTGAYVSHLDLEKDIPLEFADESTRNIEGVTMIGELIVLVGEGPNGNAPSKMYYLSKSDEVTLDMSVFLQGCFDVVSGTMTTDLFAKNVLPGQSNNIDFGQPYNYPPFDYAGTEGDNWSGYQNNAVDWVLISLREEVDDKEFFKIAGILESNGQISFPYPNPKVLTISDIPDFDVNYLKGFYVTIQHRNHLTIMSECIQITLDSMSIVMDFTKTNSYTANQSATGQIVVGSYYCMAAGNIDQDVGKDYGTIDGNDRIEFVMQNGIFNAYNHADANLNADVNGGDKFHWINNNGYFNAVKRL